MSVQVPIHVTQRHIDAGEQEDCINGPIALAVKEVTGLTVSVDDHFCPKTNKPRAVHRWIKRFDRKLRVRPLKFTLEVRGVA